MLTVIARASPDDKTRVIETLQQLGESCLMCGDGTNDMGALKKARVGLSVLSSNAAAATPAPAVQTPPKRPEDLMQALENPNQMRPGDASIAAPFTSRQSSLTCVLDLLTQGRCALVTTHQMYRVLAVNSLLASYTLSSLYLNGMKTGDFQATFNGLLTAAMFMFLSMSKPSPRLSPQRPADSVFNPHLLVSVAV